MPKKIKVKNDVAHLLAAACNHKDCPEWLKSKIWNTLESNSRVPSFCPEQLALMLKYSTLDKNTESIGWEVIDSTNSNDLEVSYEQSN